MWNRIGDCAIREPFAILCILPEVIWPNSQSGRLILRAALLFIGCGSYGHFMTQKPEFTEAQKDRIKGYYQSTPPDDFNLFALAAELNKSRQNICRFARKTGLTRRGRSPNANTLAKLTGVPKWNTRSHPKGFSGRAHKQESRMKISKASKLSWATHKAFGTGLMSKESREMLAARASKNMRLRDPSRVYTRAKGGKRPDLNNQFFRSSWEANYARYLNLLIKMKVVEYWEFEPETFWFPVKRGTLSYKPDFKVKYANDPIHEYVEIKGWIVPKDRTKWRRMKKHHPHIKLIVVANKEYQAIKRKWASAIPHWE